MRTGTTIGQSGAVAGHTDPIPVKLYLERGGEAIRGRIVVGEHEERFSGPLELMAMLREATAVDQVTNRAQPTARHRRSS
jgi:hypothetical protein